MPAPPKKRATYEDVLAAPPMRVAEIVDGELYVQPRPARPHTHVATSLQGELFGPFQKGRGGPGGWFIYFEPELHLGDDILVPDIAGWHRSRMPDDPDLAFFTLAPDWVCEVLSPSTARLDRFRKLPIYARERVPYAWLVDPEARTVEALKLESERWTILGVYSPEEEGQDGSSLARIEPFDAIELDLASLWEGLGPALPAE